MTNMKAKSGVKTNQKTPDHVAINTMIQQGWKPLEKYKNAHERWKSRCLTCKRISYPRYKHVRMGSRCRYCSGHLVDPKEAIEFMRTNHFEPQVEYPTSQKPWKSKCLKCGKVSSPTYSHVVQRGHCCRHCAPNAAVKKETALATFEKAGFEILGTYKNTKTGVLLKCLKCNKESKKTYSDVRQGQGCGFCAGNKPLAPSEAKKFFLKNGLKPLEPFVNVNLPWKSKCLKCGKLVSPTYGNVRSGKRCPYCMKNKVDPEDAVRLMISYGYKPLEPYVNSRKKWKSIHVNCGKEVAPQYAQVQQGYGACRHCAISGFQYSRSSYLYFIRNDKYRAFKVGIANKQENLKRDRLRKFGHDGWEAIKIWEFEEGTLPSRVEAKFFSFLRLERGINQFLTSDEMQYGGATETFSAEVFSERQVISLINSLIRQLKEEIED
jgi:hypothetical protein